MVDGYQALRLGLRHVGPAEPIGRLPVGPEGLAAPRQPLVAAWLPVISRWRC
jgi:hypothetical protein